MPGLKEPIRIHEGWIEGETGWRRIATAEEEAMVAALEARSAPEPGTGGGPDGQA